MKLKKKMTTLFTLCDYDSVSFGKQFTINICT